MRSDAVLLNAEPFGFGPAAAAASLARSLKGRGLVVGYIGGGHSLDLQQLVGYADIFDISGLDEDAKDTAWQTASTSYGIFVTAMDFKAADDARRAGMKVVIYDALAWYWPHIPIAARLADLYLVQDFYGVSQRITTDMAGWGNVVVVPPIVAPKRRDVRSDMVLLNLGGLQNPGWSVRDAADYAQLMIDAARKALQHVRLVIATSTAVAALLDDDDVRTYDNEEMQHLFAQASYALMTPGLGNIYDAAAYGLPTIWLPAANDSQGRQLDMLLAHGCCDAAITWSQLEASVDFTAPQPEVLGTIVRGIASLKSSPERLGRLYDLVKAACTVLVTGAPGGAAKLLDEFGSDGMDKVAVEVMQLAGKGEHVRA